MSNFTMSHAAPDHDLQKMLHCQFQALQFEFSSRKPPRIHVVLVANRQEVQIKLVIYRFMSTLQDHRPRNADTGDALLMSWQQPCTFPTAQAGVQSLSRSKKMFYRSRDKHSADTAATEFINISN